MDFDPSVALHAQQRFVASHAAGLLLVEGPTRSGRTFALLARAHRLISAETGDAEDIRQRDGLGAGLALRAVFVAPSRHEANAAAECLAMETGGYRPLAFGVADIASELLASELAESGPTARRIVARSTWQRVAIEALDAELRDAGIRSRLWPFSGEALRRRSVRLNAIAALQGLRLSGNTVNTNASANKNENVAQATVQSERWHELRSFGDRLDAQLAERRLLDPTGVVELAIRRLRTNTWHTNHRHPFTGAHLLVDDAHRISPLHRILLAELACPTRVSGHASNEARNPVSIVVTGNNALNAWTAEFLVSGESQELSTSLPQHTGPVVLEPPSERSPRTELVRLRHRSLEAEAVVSVIEQAVAEGTSYARIAIVVPHHQLPVTIALQRVAARRGVPLRRGRWRIASEPLVSCLIDLTRWSVTHDGRLLEAAVGIGLIQSAEDSRLPREAPQTAASLAATAFDLWEHIVAPEALRSRPASTHAVRLFIGALQHLARAGTEAPGSVLSPEALLALVDVAAATDASQPRIHTGNDSIRVHATTAEALPHEVENTDLDNTDPDSVGDDDDLDNTDLERMGDDDDAFDAVDVLSVAELAGRSFDLVVLPSMVEGTWPRKPSVVDDGWDSRDLANSLDSHAYERDRWFTERQRAIFLDAVHRSTKRVVAVAAPEPGVLVSRFVEGWPDGTVGELGTADESLSEYNTVQASKRRPLPTPETDGNTACFPEPGLRLSATRLDTFENCRLNFAFQYVAGVRGPGGVPASVGTMVHATLEAFLLPFALLQAADTPGAAAEVRAGETADSTLGTDADRSRDRLFELLDANWDPRAFPYRPQEADYRNRAEQWLDKWFEMELPKLREVIAVEHRFSVPVGPHTLSGSIDRVSVTTDGEIEIVDYKTGSPPRLKDRIDPDNLQLATYHLAAVTDLALRQFGPPSRLRLHFLTESVDVQQPVRPNHESETQARILSAASAIISEDFTPSVEADCEYCSFKKLCPLQPEGRTVESLHADTLDSSAHLSSAHLSAAHPRSTTVPPEPPERAGNDTEQNHNDSSNDVVGDNEETTSFEPLDEQTHAIIHSGSPLLIVAGAGSGKTTVLAKRIVHLVKDRGWRPDQILGLTFSNKAAGNLRSRVARELGVGNDAQIMTYHGFGGSILARYGERIGLPTHPVLLDRARAWQLLLDSLNDVSIRTRKTGKISSLVNDALSLASSCADHVVSLDTVEADCQRLLAASATVHDSVVKAARGRLDLVAMARAYERAKHVTGCIDFGDQIALAVRLVEEHPDVAATLRDTFPVALLDEYQDTNYAQRRLVETLYRGSSELTAVGDDMQSIYAFRGAHIRNLLSFEDHFPGASEARLETNHRSGPEVVRLAGSIQGRVDNARPKELRASGRIPTANVERFVASDDFDEAQRIASRCLELHRSGQPWADIAVLCRKRRLIQTIAETLTSAGVPVEVIGLGGLLQRPEIVDLVAWLEVVASGGAARSATSTQAHNGPGAGTNALTAPDPSVSLLRILRGEPYRLGMRDVAALSRAARRRTHPPTAGSRPETAESYRPTKESRTPTKEREHHDILDLLVAVNDVADVPDLSSDAWTRVHAFNSVRIALVEAHAQLPLVDLLETILSHTQSWSRVDARGNENLVRFIDLAARFVPLPLPARGSWFGNRALLEFLEYLQLIAMSEEDQPEAMGVAVDAVNVMTIHQAKGLEFETVFVPGLAGHAKSLSKIFPDVRLAENGATQAVALPQWLKGDADPNPPLLARANDLSTLRNEASLEREREELRLFYVAATRAKTRLIFSAAHWYAGVIQPQGLSPFYDVLESVEPPIIETHRAAPAAADPAIAEMQRRYARYLAQMTGSRGADPAGSQGTATTPTTPSAIVSPGTPTGPTRRTKKAAQRNNDQSSLFLSDVGAPVRAVGQPALPTAFATTSLSTYVRCPRRFFWSVVRPLPRRPSEAARIGSEVHRWIELQSNGQLVLSPNGLSEPPATDSETTSAHAYPYVESDDVEIPRPAGGAADEISLVEFFGAAAPLSGTTTPRAVAARSGYRRSRYAERTPRHVEMPFSLAIAGRVVRGRVDAIYARLPGVHDRPSAADVRESSEPADRGNSLARAGIEIVDFKTGHAPSSAIDHGHGLALADSDPTTIQLDVYGLVAMHVLGYRPDEIAVTACYLGGDDGPEYRTRPWSEPEATAARTRVTAALDAIADRRFDPAPGTWCSHCDFEAFCEGAARVVRSPDSPPDPLSDSLPRA